MSIYRHLNMEVFLGFDDKEDPTSEPILYIRKVPGCLEFDCFAFLWDNIALIT